jgi:Tol biopolymer transport system component
VLGREAVLLLILAIAAGCQGTPAATGGGSESPAAPTPAPTGSAGPAAFVVASMNGLLTLDEQGRMTGRLVELPKDTFASGPSLDPAGRRLAFSLLNISQTVQNGFGADIYLVSADGSGLRSVVTHERENTFYSGPVFDPTGRFLYFQRRSTVLRDNTAVTDDGIERLDLETGERRRILADGTDPTISPDGKTMVFVHLVRNQVDTMWVADADGTNARPFFKVKDRFFYLQTPRFAPTGCQLVFSGAGRTARGGGSAGSINAHLGIPSELYLSPCDGSSIATIGETYDDVTPVWSRDGGRIAYALAGAVSVVTIATRETKKLAQGDAFSFGELVWLR